MPVTLPDDLACDLIRFESALTRLANRLQLDLTQFAADHISLRCNQHMTAEKWKIQLLNAGVLFSENSINGRPIALFSLHEKITIGPWRVDCIELPWPGKKHYSHQGWEHVELLLPGDPSTLHARALACLSDTALALPDIRLKCSQPGAERERLPNPTLAVTDGEVTIKFHPFSIRDIVMSER